LKIETFYMENQGTHIDTAINRQNIIRVQGDWQVVERNI
jgi:hypothetical protein